MIPDNPQHSVKQEELDLGRLLTFYTSPGNLSCDGFVCFGVPQCCRISLLWDATTATAVLCANIAARHCVWRDKTAVKLTPAGSAAAVNADGVVPCDAHVSGLLQTCTWTWFNQLLLVVLFT